MDDQQEQAAKPEARLRALHRQVDEVPEDWATDADVMVPYDEPDPIVWSVQCGKRVECGGRCVLAPGHVGECECGGDDIGVPGSCPA